MSDTDRTSSEDEAGLTSDASGPPPKEMREVEAQAPPRINPLTREVLATPWVDMDRVRPPPDYIEAMGRMSLKAGADPSEGGAAGGVQGPIGPRHQDRPS
jgi:hypothetical protein